MHHVKESQSDGLGISKADDGGSADVTRAEIFEQLGILDSSPDPRFDRIVELARDLIGVPIALISLTDRERQWFKSRIGLDAQETPRDGAFCDVAIRDAGPLIVPDATKDARFAANPLVTGAPEVRFYAGWPIVLSSGVAIGTLCMFDTQLRILADHQIRHMQTLASLVAQEMDSDLQIADLRDAHHKAGNRANHLQRLKTHYKSVLDACNESIAIYDPVFDPAGKIVDFRFLDCNQAAIDMRGLDREHLIGRLLTDLVPNLTAEHVARYASVIETGQAATFENRYVDDNYDDWFLVNASASSQGKLVLLLTTITESKQVEFQLRRSRDALENFTSVVSHDLKTPLNHVGGYVHLLQHDLSATLSAEHLEYMGYVTDGVTQMRQLIDAMQKHARLGQIVVSRENIDLRVLMEKLEKRFAEPLAAAGGRLRYAGQSLVYADPVLLDQLLSNLISNAIRYRSPERSLIIDVACRQDDINFHIDVADNGKGIDPDYHEDVFTLFSRGSETEPAENSMGLGLATCREIAQAHGGRIRIRPKSDPGTTFALCLPSGKSLGD